MGWLGWTEEQALNTSIQAIWTAYEGRVDMLKALFGGGDDDGGKPTISERPMTGALFDAMFG